MRTKTGRRLRIAFLMNPLKGWDFDGDTSLSIIAECHRRNHSLYYLEPHDLLLKAPTLWALVRPCAPSSRTGLAVEAPRWINLETLDALLIRKEPPFDFGYLACTYLLDFLRGKIYLMNDPAGIRSANEKLSSLLFPRRPHSAAGLTYETLLPFLKSLKGPAVLKRIDEKGGIGVVKTSARDPGLRRLIRTLTEDGTRPVLAQEFVPHAKGGDKRILLLGGRPIGAFVRYPPKTDFRANMAVGGTAGPGKVNASDRAIIRSIAPYLKKHGLDFVGIDVLGKKLTEINVTSPAGIPEINEFSGTRPEEATVDFIEERSRRRIARGSR